MTTSYGRFPKRGVARRLLFVLSALLVAALASTAPASAIVTTVSTVNGNVSVGLLPRNQASFIEGMPAVASFDNPAGNSVVHASNVYAIYWDPTNSYHGDWQDGIDRFLRDVGAQSGSLSSIFAVNAQYTDKTNLHASNKITFRGAYTDTNPYPTAAGCVDPAPLLSGDAITCVTDLEVQQQLASFIIQHNLPKGMESIFYVLTPPGVTVCLDGGGMNGHCSDSENPPSTSYSNSFCSYHSAISPTNAVTGDGNTILYAMIPWTAGGVGDYHLAPGNRANAVACQDGGFDPSSKPIEKHERPHERNEEEEEAFKKKSPEEQIAILEQEAREGPHEQQPNQVGLGSDGSYDEGLYDLITNQIAAEQQDTVTDPLLNGWKDSEQNEAIDECRNFFAYILGGSSAAAELTLAGNLYNQELNEGHYYLNTTFNAAALRLSYPGIPCLTGVRLEPKFTSPNPVSSGDIVGFDGMQSVITLNAAASFSPAGVKQSNYATYAWNFGDGTPVVSGFAPGAPSVNSPGAAPCAAPWLTPCAGSTFHSYQYGGNYTVTLTVTDVGGNTASVSHEITVVGPLPPGSPGTTGTTGASTTGGATGSGGIVQPFIAGPVAHAAAASQSLKTALSKGLLVSYSVNEEVAGHFEVLLPSATARKLGIKGSKAQGLPKGTAPSTVIAQALLVTTKGGHSSLRIKFSKSTAKHLRGQRKLTLTLRLIVRNAATQNPASTTVLSKVVLHR